MAQKSIDEVLEIAAEARRDSEQWAALLDEAHELYMPNRNLRRGRGNGQERAGKAFDSTAAQALQRGASRLVSDFTPPFVKFVDLEAGPYVPESEAPKLNAQLAPGNAVAATQYQDGQYHNAAQEMAQDLLLGTGSMLINPAVRSARRLATFTAVPEATLDFSVGVDGRHDGWFRDVPVKASLVERQWDDAKIPAALAKLKAEKPNETVTLKEATYFDYEDEVFRYEVIFTGAGVEPARIVSRTSLTSPWITPRWSVTAGERRGRGPGLNALPDVRVLNKVIEMVLQNAAMAIAGMYTVIQDGVVNPDTVRIAPALMIPVARNGGSLGRTIEPLTPDRNFDVSQLLTQDLRMFIKKALLDNQLPPDNGRDPTAFEIMQRMRELAQDASVAYGRLVSEWLIPMHARVLEILVSRGAIKDFVPIDQLFVKVKVSSPLARMQDLDEVEQAIRWVMMVRQAGGDQAIPFVVKIEALLAWIGSKLGVKPEFIVNDAEREQMRAAAMKAMLAAQAQDAAGQAPNAEAAPARPPLRVVA